MDMHNTRGLTFFLSVANPLISVFHAKWPISHRNGHPVPCCRERPPWSASLWHLGVHPGPGLHAHGCQQTQLSTAFLPVPACVPVRLSFGQRVVQRVPCMGYPASSSLPPLGLRVDDGKAATAATVVGLLLQCSRGLRGCTRILVHSALAGTSVHRVWCGSGHCICSFLRLAHVFTPSAFARHEHWPL